MTTKISIKVEGKEYNLLGGRWEIKSGVNPHIEGFQVDKNIPFNS
jgi:hypothetical protein